MPGPPIGVAPYQPHRAIRRCKADVRYDQTLINRAFREHVKIPSRTRCGAY